MIAELMFLVAAGALSPAASGPHANPEMHFVHCLKGHAEDCTFFFSRKAKVPVYEEPKASSAVRWHTNAGMALRIDWSRTRQASRPGWAYVDNNGEMETGWIQVSQVAGYGDFRRVVKCWPIRSLEDDDERLGDFMLAAEFAEDGSGHITSEGGRKIHLWFTPDLILIGENADMHGYVYGFDKKTNTFYQASHAYKLHKVKRSSIEQSCRSGFVTK